VGASNFAHFVRANKSPEIVTRILLAAGKATLEKASRLAHTRRREKSFAQA